MVGVIALVATCGYLLGSVPVGYLVGRLYGIDVREYGSGATGGTNVLRTLGVGAAVVTAALDMLKGTLAAWLGYRLGQEWGYALGTLAAMLGHSYPVWIGFRGGKAVATGAGGMVLRHPQAVLVGLAVGMGCILPTRYVSLGSLAAAATVGLYLLATQPLPDKVLGAAAAAIIVWRHRSNIQRLLAGTEHRLGEPAAPRGGR